MLNNDNEENDPCPTAVMSAFYQRTMPCVLTLFIMGSVWCVGYTHFVARQVCESQIHLTSCD